MTDTTRSAKGERRAKRKALRARERRLDSARRSRNVFSVLAAIALVAFVLCATDIWCLFHPLVHMLAFSSVTGLALGATIRVIRERRELQARKP